MIHEGGHLVAAKSLGMKATKYFLGFGPTLWSFQRGETEYGIKAIPAGGYVRIIGMNSLEEVEPEDENRAYRNKPFWQKSVVVMAGILPGQQLADYRDEEIDLVMNVNFMGPARLIRSLLPHFSEEAHIILTSSVSGVRGSYDPIYAASKAALIGFTKSLATWLAPNVRVNALAPALVQDSTMYQDMPPERREKHAQDSPAGQLTTLEEIADLVLELVGPAWSRTSGAVISIDSVPK